MSRPRPGMSFLVHFYNFGKMATSLGWMRVGVVPCIEALWKHAFASCLRSRGEKNEPGCQSGRTPRCGLAQSPKICLVCRGCVSCCLQHCYGVRCRATRRQRRPKMNLQKQDTGRKLRRECFLYSTVLQTLIGAVAHALLVVARGLIVGVNDGIRGNAVGVVRLRPCVDGVDVGDEGAGLLLSKDGEHSARSARSRSQ